VGVGDGYRVEQPTGIRVCWVFEDCAAGPNLNHLAEVHHSYAVGDVFHYRQIVADE
jgi:hypothetical protein